MTVLKRVEVVGTKWQVGDRVFTAADLKKTNVPCVKSISLWLSDLAKILNSGVTFETLSDFALRNSDLYLQALTVEIDAGMRMGCDLKEIFSQFYWLKLEILIRIFEKERLEAHCEEELLLASKLYDLKFEYTESYPYHRRYNFVGRFFYMLKLLLDYGFSVNDSFSFVGILDLNLHKNKVQKLLKLLQEELTFHDMLRFSGLFPEEILGRFKNLTTDEEIHKEISNWYKPEPTT